MLRREDCVKRDVKKAGEEEDWKKKTRARGLGGTDSDEAVKKSESHCCSIADLCDLYGWTKR